MGLLDDLRGELAALERAAERVRAEIAKLHPTIRFGSDLDRAAPIRFGMDCGPLDIRGGDANGLPLGQTIRVGDATGYPGSPPARADLSSDVHFYLNGERVGFIRGSDGAVLDSTGKVLSAPPSR
jgi:hypothetical protein